MTNDELAVRSSIEIEVKSEDGQRLKDGGLEGKEKEHGEMGDGERGNEDMKEAGNFRHWRLS